MSAILNNITYHFAPASSGYKRSFFNGCSIIRNIGKIGFNRISTKTLSLRAMNGKQGTKSGKRNRKTTANTGSGILLRIEITTGQHGPTKSERI
jgi:hypothetical protein